MDSTKDIKLRKATVQDIPFLVETIIEAEKAGTQILTYSTIFGFNEDEAEKYLTYMLEEEVEDCELSVSSFLIAEMNNKPVASSCAWIEAKDGIPSNILKGNLLKYTLPKQAIEKALSINNIIHELYFEYKPNTIHFGVGYVINEYRGKGLFGLLKNEQIKSLKAQNNDITEAYVDIFGHNASAIRANEKLGFKVIEIKESSNKRILNYLPSNKKILLKKTIN